MNDLTFVQQLCDGLGLQAADPHLIVCALQHPSYVREAGLPLTESNQRLEFLGDAVLDLVLAEHLFSHGAGLTEGELTKLKSTLARENALARVGRRLGLGEYLRLGRGEEETGGREKASLIADGVEALIAAVYLSNGMASARDFVLTHFEDEIDAALRTGPSTDPKTALQELIQERTKRPPQYHTVSVKGPAHDPSFASECRFRGVVIGRGSGRSKREAEKEAAQAALSDPEAIWAAIGEVSGGGGSERGTAEETPQQAAGDTDDTHGHLDTVTEG